MHGQWHERDADALFTRGPQGLGASQQREREVAAGGEALAGAGDRSSASALRAPTAAICDSRTLHFSNAGIRNDFTEVPEGGTASLQRGASFLPTTASRARVHLSSDFSEPPPPRRARESASCPSIHTALKARLAQGHGSAHGSRAAYGGGGRRWTQRAARWRLIAPLPPLNRLRQWTASACQHRQLSGA